MTKPLDEPPKKCTKCGRTKKATEFFKLKNGERCDMCKPCLSAHINNNDPQTFLWILEKFDIPYIESVWVKQSNTAFIKNPHKFGPMSVIGTYIRTMQMAQYKDYCYADSDKLNFEHLKQEELRRQEEANRSIDEKYEADLKSKLDAGEIGAAEYNTLSRTNTDTAEVPKGYNGKIALESPKYLQNVRQVNEDTIKSELTQDDVQYLALKWGLLYKPSQWVTLEKKYQEYASQYELSVDREDILIKICKVSLKMDEALDIDDIKTFKDLSVTYDALRKSGKFTEAQRQEETQREIDSIGELVAFVEHHGGAIPNYQDTIEYPQDKVDFTIRDMKHYVDKLVREELGLSDLIESFIEKSANNKSESVEEIMTEQFEGPDEDRSSSQTFQDFLHEEIEAESYKLVDEFADGE